MWDVAVAVGCCVPYFMVQIENGNGIIRWRKVNCGGKIWVIGKCRND